MFIKKEELFKFELFNGFLPNAFSNLGIETFIFFQTKLNFGLYSKQRDGFVKKLSVLLLLPPFRLILTV